MNWEITKSEECFPVGCIRVVKSVESGGNRILFISEN